MTSSSFRAILYAKMICCYFLLSSCQNSTLNEGKSWKLIATDSFQIKPPIEQEGSKSEQLLTTINTQILYIGNKVLLAFFSPDSTITLREVNRVGNDQKISLHNAFGMVPSFPNSFIYSGDTFFLFYKDAAQLLKIDRTGQVVASLHLNRNAAEACYVTPEYPLGYNHGQFYLRTFLADAPPNFIPSFCDQIYLQHGDSLVPATFTLGRYPADFTSHWVILRNAFRTLVPGGQTIYGFAGSDSLFRFDAAGNMLWRGKIESQYGGRFAQPNPNEMGNIKYLNEYYRTEEQNLFFKFNPMDSTLFLVKKLRDTTAKNSQTDLIVLGKALTTQKEIRLNGQPLKRDIFFIQQDTLFSGSLYTGWVIKYKIAYEK